MATKSEPAFGIWHNHCTQILTVTPIFILVFKWTPA